MHEHWFTVSVVLEHGVTAEITRYRTSWESGGGDPSSGHCPSFTECQEGESEYVLVAIRESEPLQVGISKHSLYFCWFNVNLYYLVENENSLVFQ